MKTQLTYRRRRAFTLVELLVVIGIIGLLAGLIVGLGGLAHKAKLKRVQAEMANLETAIANYQSKKGFYPPSKPPSNTNDPAINTLFYELTGVVYDPRTSKHLTVNGPGETLTTARIQNAFGVDGFMNSSTDPGEVINFLKSANKDSQYRVYGSSPWDVYLLVVAIEGPTNYPSASGDFVNPWRYVSSNPTNNADKYDLWVDVKVGGDFYRVSNWKTTPIRITP